MKDTKSTYSGTDYLKSVENSQKLARRIENSYKFNTAIPKKVREKVDVWVEVDPVTKIVSINSNIMDLMPSITTMEERFM